MSTGLGNPPKHCNCVDWDPNIRQVDAPFALLTARNPESYCGYRGKVFDFCPWCGKQLMVIEIVGSADSADGGVRA